MVRAPESRSFLSFLFSGRNYLQKHEQKFGHKMTIQSNK